MMFSYFDIFTTDHIALMPNGLKVLGHIIFFNNTTTLASDIIILMFGGVGHDV